MLPLAKDDLVVAMAHGERFAFRPFYGHTRRADDRLSDACFSQWYAHPFERHGVRYATAEHFMMVEKARLFGDARALEAILACGSPAEAKALGRSVHGYDDARWEARRLDAVTEGNVAKFTSTAELRADLLATGDDVLVEAAPRDRVWGIGLGRDNPLVQVPAKWRGRNLLGFALMRARAQLRGG